VRATLAFCLLGLLTAGAAQAQDKGGPVKIGIAAPLTGPYAAFGAQVKNGASQAIEDINKAGGIKGRLLEPIYGDDASDPKQGVSVANKLAAEGAKMVVGAFASGVSIPASDVYLDAGIIQVTPASTNVKFTDRGMWNTFRTCGRDDQQGVVAGTYLADHFKDKRIAFVHDKSAYGRGLAQETQMTLKAKGGKEVLFEGVNPGEKDYSALVSKLKSANVDVVYYGGYHTEAGLILRQMRDQGLKATMVGGDGLAPKEFVQIAGDGADGTLMTFSPDARKNPNAQAAVAAFKAKNIDPDAYTLYAYAAVQVLARAVAETGSSEGKVLADWLHQGKTIETVVGPIAYDKKGDLTRPDYIIYAWTKGPDGKIDYAGHELTP
jgi:branched-chain amino acid transport system substrate-binding protein